LHSPANWDPVEGAGPSIRLSSPLSSSLLS
jgi:hypothetical protein